MKEGIETTEIKDTEEEEYEISSINRSEEYRNYLEKLREGGERTLDFVLPEI